MTTEVGSRDGAARPGGERRVVANVIRGSIGNLIEWYDWYAYTAFSVYFAAAFFPDGDLTAQLLNTAGVFAIGFLMRPLAGALSDRIGRRWLLLTYGIAGTVLTVPIMTLLGGTQIPYL
ncbi:alpha-ketoglutarate transporter, partial [Saccharopolyspora sp. WRP15-2]|nr:alpha-ketoglutarate transporter [Saccharopolyspora oryzae]